MRKTISKILLGAFLVSAIAVACNSKKEKKEDPPKEDTTTKVEPAPTVPADTTKPADTGDVRPVKPGE